MKQKDMKKRVLLEFQHYVTSHKADSQLTLIPLTFPKINPISMCCFNMFFIFVNAFKDTQINSSAGGDELIIMKKALRN